ncbi:MAG TPA: hypothetical protein VE986_07825 [Hyphomicrobiales bacterium]|nr:hypothetical protein [Hyphomicrobiales bacterium]
MQKNEEQSRLEAQELQQSLKNADTLSPIEAKGLEALEDVKKSASSGSNDKKEPVIDEARINARIGEFYAKVLADVAKEPIPEDWLKRLDEIDKRERK